MHVEPDPVPEAVAEVLRVAGLVDDRARDGVDLLLPGCGAERVERGRDVVDGHDRGARRQVDVGPPGGVEDVAIAGIEGVHR